MAFVNLKSLLRSITLSNIKVLTMGKQRRHTKCLNEKYELHRLLGALFSKSLSATEKLNIIETEYDIPIKENIREEVNIMCNLSQGIREAERNDIIMNMYKKGYTIEQISDVVEKSIEDIKAVIEKMKMALV